MTYHDECDNIRVIIWNNYIWWRFTYHLGRSHACVLFLLVVLFMLETVNHLATYS